MNIKVRKYYAIVTLKEEEEDYFSICYGDVFCYGNVHNSKYIHVSNTKDNAVGIYFDYLEYFENSKHILWKSKCD